ncbi:amidase [Streptomyces sp. NPDC019224]|uniref:amidase n=1 Tax=Streptomyces sp. NPDC019224 TaxID=3154484 RepID=UPI0033FB1B9A
MSHTLGGLAPGLPATLAVPLAERLARTAAPSDGRDGPAGGAAEIADWEQRADARYRACAELRPSFGDGLRVGVKDTVDVAGFATRLGLPGYRHYPERTAAVLAGLPHGSVNAKLVTTELSIGLEHGCLNPYFPHLDPGGSSTGCAVAVAAGICDLAMGTDTVASVRLPAGACGVVGLRLTHDRRLLSGLFGLSDHLDAPGWITRTVDDLAHLWERLPLDGGLRAQDGGAPGPRSRYRIGVVREGLDPDTEPVVAAAFDEALRGAARAGHTLVDVRLDELFHRRGLAYELCAREAWDNFLPVREAVGERLSGTTLAALESGARVGEGRYRELLDLHREQRGLAALRFARDGADVWLMPAGTLLPRNIHTEPAPASTIPDPAETAKSPHVNYAAVASFAGLPAITFPIGHSAEHDAPICLQAIGPAHSEAALIDLARRVTELTGGVRFTPADPPLPEGVLGRLR